MSEEWKTRAVAEMNELGERCEALRKTLVKGLPLGDQVTALLQAQYRGMVAYYDALVARMRLCGVVDVETPPLVRDEAAPVTAKQWDAARGEPAAVEVTVTAPAGKRAEVCHAVGDKKTMFAVTPGQSQTWSVMRGEWIGVAASDTSTVAHKRDDS